MLLDHLSFVADFLPQLVNFGLHLARAALIRAQLFLLAPNFSLFHTDYSHKSVNQLMDGQSLTYFKVANFNSVVLCLLGTCLHRLLQSFDFSLLLLCVVLHHGCSLHELLELLRDSTDR